MRGKMVCQKPCFVCLRPQHRHNCFEISLHLSPQTWQICFRFVSEPVCISSFNLEGNNGTPAQVVSSMNCGCASTDTLVRTGLCRPCAPWPRAEQPPDVEPKRLEPKQKHFNGTPAQVLSSILCRTPCANFARRARCRARAQKPWVETTTFHLMPLCVEDR